MQTAATYFRLAVFGTLCITAVYLFSALIFRRFKKIELRKVIVYITAVAMIGVVGEIFVDTIYNFFFGTPLWRYNFLPVHHAYTSQYSPLLWGTFGFYLYLLHSRGKAWVPKSTLQLAAAFGIEAIAIEALADLASRPILGDYLYYYYPSGLWHVSAFQGIPFYFLCGRLIFESIHFFKSSPRFFLHLSVWIIVVTVYFK